MERFLAEVCTPAWNYEQDAGRTWDEAVAVLQRAHPEEAELIAAYRDRWDEMLGEPIDGMPELLAEVKGRGLGIYALTNWSAETFHHAEARYPFLEAFDGIVVSGRIRLAKPDPRIYEHLASTHRVEPRRAAFIDDNLPNVETALRLGFAGIHFTSESATRERLVRLGVV
jgi:2-haloacid dehalogenase